MGVHQQNFGVKTDEMTLAQLDLNQPCG